MSYELDPSQTSIRAIDWRDKWPSILPDDFVNWLLHRLAIYVSAAAIVTFVCLFIAAKMAGYSIEAYIAMLAVVVAVIGMRHIAHDI